MPFRVSVGPPVLTINQGNTFMVTQPDGQIMADGELGVFAEDTRFVSYYAIFANGLPWTRLNSSTTSYATARVYLTNPEIETEDGTIAPGTVELVLNRVASNGIHEDIDITNYGLHPVKFNLEIVIRSDFADIFEVKAHRFVRRGNIITSEDKANQEVSTSYTNRDFHRCFTYQVRNASSVPQSANGRTNFLVELEAGATWHMCGCYLLKIDGESKRVPSTQCYQPSSDAELRRQRSFSS